MTHTGCASSTTYAKRSAGVRTIEWEVSAAGLHYRDSGNDHVHGFRQHDSDQRLGSHAMIDELARPTDSIVDRVRGKTRASLPATTAIASGVARMRSERISESVRTGVIGRTGGNQRLARVRAQ